jgi:hypothetical protein
MSGNWLCSPASLNQPNDQGDNSAKEKKRQEDYQQRPPCTPERHDVAGNRRLWVAYHLARHCSYAPADPGAALQPNITDHSHCIFCHRRSLTQRDTTGNRDRASADLPVNTNGASHAYDITDFFADRNDDVATNLNPIRCLLRRCNVRKQGSKGHNA